MKKLLIILPFVISFYSLTAQSNGNYFKMKSGEYFEKVINPWKYQFIAAKADSSNKIGQIIFWRSKPIYDNIAKKNWTPNIAYEIFNDSTQEKCETISKEIKESSTCDSLNKGGNMLYIGHFVLLNTSQCVNCASSSNVDYCRNIIKKIIGSISNADTDNWQDILDQLIINEKKYIK